MRKLLGLAVIALVVTTYQASPDAVRTGMAGVTSLGRDVFRAAVGAVGDTTTGSDTGSTRQLPDGSWVRIPPGYELPTETPTTVKP